MAETREAPARFITVEPVLAVRDVAAAAAYYRDVLGFEDVWLWGEPPTHGGAFLTGDNAGFYDVRDVMVHPDWQGRRIGTALMQALMDYLKACGPEHGMAGLFTGPHLHDFYAQFGFRGPKSGLYGMARF